MDDEIRRIRVKAWLYFFDHPDYSPAVFSAFDDLNQGVFL